MAYLFGLLTKEEKKDLEDRGWSFESPENIVEELREVEKEGSNVPANNVELCAVYVDSNLHDIMTGPDWEKAAGYDPIGGGGGHGRSDLPHGQGGGDD